MLILAVSDNLKIFSIFRTFYHYLRQFESEKSHIVVKGEGEKFFSAGGDVKIVKFDQKLVIYQT